MASSSDSFTTCDTNCESPEQISSNGDFFTACSDGEGCEASEDTFKDVISLETSNGDDSYQELDSETVVDEEISDNDKIKAALIVDCLHRNDVRSLRALGRERAGFVCDQLRRMVWPKVCKVDVIATSPRPDTKQMESHPFYTQVVLDVNRSLKRFPPSIAEQHRLSMQQQLINLIMRVLIKNPSFFYYQGYHDICITFLLVLGEEMAFHVVNIISQSHLRVFMEKTMESTANLLEIIPLIIKQEDEKLANFLAASEVGNIFCLSWIITWFSHVLKNYQTVGRLFDLFLVSDKYMSLYLTASIVLYKSEEVFNLNCDLASVHHYLTRTVESEETLPFEELIVKAQQLIVKYPPQLLAQEKMQQKEQQLRQRQQYSLLSLLNVRSLFRKATTFGFISLAVVVVISASLFQFFRNQS